MMMSFLFRIFLAAGCLLPVVAAAEFPTLHLKPVVLSQIHSPTTITHAGDGSGRLFFCDQPGVIYVMKDGMMMPDPFLDLSSTGKNVVFPAPAGYSERGLLGLAFHPDFEDAAKPGFRKFYVYYSAPAQTNQNPTTPQDSVSVISEFQAGSVNPDLADPASERILLTFGQPQGNHNGGQLAFGPDGFLYIGSGDGGSANDNNAGHTGGNGTQPAGVLGNALDQTNLLGKILRIDPLGSNGPGGGFGIPASNPFVGEGGGVREEIHAYGLRNPWRFSFDQRNGGTNRLFCGDVGQGRVEEVNLITAGGNYGWRYREGSFDFDSTMVGAGTAPVTSIDPIAEYAHNGTTIGSPALPQLGVSITGGFVYRGAAIPELHGKYVFADYRDSAANAGRLMGLEETSPLSGTFTLTPAISLTEANPLSGSRRILTLGEDEDGEIYIGTKTTGGVVTIDPATQLPAGGIYRIVPLESSTTDFEPVRDNTIFSNSTSNSAGKGYLYAGRINGGGLRRALIAFDLSSIPAGTSISSASLSLFTNLSSASSPGPATMTLRKISALWGEGTSLPSGAGGQGATATTGDATWLSRIFNTDAWTTPGGDFSGTDTASTIVDGEGDYLWSSSQLTADAQSWVDSPSTNQGWILIGDESVDFTARRFGSKDLTDGAIPGDHAPTLSLTFPGPPATRPFDEFLAIYFPGTLTGQYIAPDGDGDGMSLQEEHAYGFSPLIHQAAPDRGFSVTRLPGGAGTILLTSTFRRNPLATDMTIELQVSDALESWTTIATSTAGGNVIPGNGGIVFSEEVISGQSPARLVTIQLSIPSGTGARFVRVKTTRAF
jgi:glucose/arabinose dehydrogenase